MLYLLLRSETLSTMIRTAPSLSTTDYSDYPFCYKMVSARVCVVAAEISLLEHITLFRSEIQFSLAYHLARQTRNTSNDGQTTSVPRFSGVAACLPVLWAPRKHDEALNSVPARVRC